MSTSAEAAPTVPQVCRADRRRGRRRRDRAEAMAAALAARGNRGEHGIVRRVPLPSASAPLPRGSPRRWRRPHRGYRGRGPPQGPITAHPSTSRPGPLPEPRWSVAAGRQTPTEHTGLLAAAHQREHPLLRSVPPLRRLARWSVARGPRRWPPTSSSSPDQGRALGSTSPGGGRGGLAGTDGNRSSPATWSARGHESEEGRPRARRLDAVIARASSSWRGKCGGASEVSARRRRCGGGRRRRHLVRGRRGTDELGRRRRT